MKSRKHKPQGHTYAPRGKRVQVVLWSGETFIAKFKGKEGKFMEFLDHDSVRNNSVSSIRILPTGVLDD